MRSTSLHAVEFDREFYIRGWCVEAVFFINLNHKTNTAAVGTAIAVRCATLARGGGRLCGRRASGGGGAAAVASFARAAPGAESASSMLTVRPTARVHELVRLPFL